MNREYRSGGPLRPQHTPLTSKASPLPPDDHRRIAHLSPTGAAALAQPCAGHQFGPTDTDWTNA